MSNWAEEQAAFMVACGQSVGQMDYEQARLYADLVEEEAHETMLAADGLYGPFPGEPEWAGEPDKESLIQSVAELADGAIDTIYVCLGLLHSIGIDPQKAWDEVQRSNLAKVDPETGKVRKRDDGKVLKGPDWVPPDMARVVRESWGL